MLPNRYKYKIQLKFFFPICPRENKNLVLFLPDQQSFINGDNMNPSGRSFHTTPQIKEQISSDKMKDLPSQTDKKKRNRKNQQQMQYLMQEYQKDPSWSKETC